MIQGDHGPVAFRSFRPRWRETEFTLSDKPGSSHVTEV